MRARGVRVFHVFSPVHGSGPVRVLVTPLHRGWCQVFLRFYDFQIM